MTAYQVETFGLQWIRTEFGIGWERFELRFGTSVLGHLTCSHGPVPTAEAEAQGQRWRIEPDGIERSHLNVSRGSDGALAIMYEPFSMHSAARGVLRFHDGHQLQWLKDRAVRDAWTLATETGRPVVRFRQRVELGVVAELREAAETEPDLSLVVMFGLYLWRICREEEAVETARDDRRHRR